MHDIALVVHVLGWVFWLGTDVGVYLGAKFSERSDLGVEARLTVLQLGMLLDRAPRFAVPVVWFTGVILSRDAGYGIIPVAPALVVAIAWLVATWAVTLQPPGSRAHTIGLVAQTLFYGAVVLGMGLGGAWLLSQGSLPLWLALKWFSYVAIAIAAVLLEKTFAPAGPLFQQLAEQGASDDLNARITQALRPVYVLVLVIYGGTLVAGICGLVKPML